MNWYKIHKESMPLPRVKRPSGEDFEYKFDEEKFNLIHNKLDYYIPQEVNEPNIKEIAGFGSYGIAYDAGDKVIKYCDDSDESEFNMAQEVLNWQNRNEGVFHPCIVGVYSVEKVSNSNGVVRVVMEKVKPVSTKIVGRETAVDGASVMEMRKRIRRSGFDCWDDHSGNIGMRDDGDYVFIDLGGLIVL